LPDTQGKINGNCSAYVKNYGATGELLNRRSVRSNRLFELVSRQNDQHPHPALLKLAVETGGAFYVSPPKEDIFAPFARIIDQLRQQYVLGFVPAKLDGKRHSLAVKVKRPHVEVHARGSYIASAGAAGGR